MSSLDRGGMSERKAALPQAPHRTIPAARPGVWEA